MSQKSFFIVQRTKYISLSGFSQRSLVVHTVEIQMIRSVTQIMIRIMMIIAERKVTFSTMLQRLEVNTI